MSGFTTFHLQPTTYRSNPDLVYQAVQYREDNLTEILLFAGPENFARYPSGNVEIRSANGYLHQEIEYGWIRVDLGDWLVRSTILDSDVLQVYEDTIFHELFINEISTGTGLTNAEHTPIQSTCHHCDGCGVHDPGGP